MENQVESQVKQAQFQYLQNKDSYIECITIPGILAATSTSYSYVLTARTVALEIIAVGAKWETKGTDAGARLDVLKVPNGTAISGGTSILTTTFDIGSGSANNTWVYKEGAALKTTRGIRYLKYGESIALSTGATTITTVAGVHVCIYYRPANNGTYR